MNNWETKFLATFDAIPTAFWNRIESQMKLTELPPSPAMQPPAETILASGPENNMAQSPYPPASPDMRMSNREALATHTSSELGAQLEVFLHSRPYSLGDNRLPEILRSHNSNEGMNGHKAEAHINASGRRRTVIGQSGTTRSQQQAVSLKLQHSEALGST
ncbi:Hypothetical predicted protein [Pelobates cultripes]|uniref:Uncharacterized protein n=1 Tax=Pelobates cultripes TaxID=61616 RepID=A0AAD1RGY9_PELCU|nr:Hypothetical predicted protein [Pelobates cultripes]